MKKTKKIVSLVVVSSMMLNLTACGSLKDTLSKSKVGASDITAESVMNDANLKMQQLDSLNTADINLNFSFEQEQGKTFAGSIDLDTQLDDMTAQVTTSLTKDGATTENVSYLDQSDLLFTLDNNNYYKFDLTDISGLSSKIQSIMKIIKAIKNITSGGGGDISGLFDIFNNNSDSNPVIPSDDSNPMVPVNDSDSDSSSLFESFNIMDIISKIINMNNASNLRGTTNIDGHNLYVIKTSLNNEILDTFLNDTDASMAIPDDMLTNLKAARTVNADLYVSASDENVFGVRADLSSVMPGTSSESNYVELLVGLNSADTYELPEAYEVNSNQVSSLMKNIPSFLEKYDADTTQLQMDIMKSSNSPQLYRGLDLKSLFENFDISMLFDKKKLILAVIKALIGG